MPMLEPRWAAPANVRAAFSLRSGGMSEAPWETLNLGAHVGDDPAAVIENRRRLVNVLHLPSEPVWLNQVHGREVLEVNEHSRLASDSRPRADALVTRSRGVVLAIQVADCLPVLFSSRDGRVLGAAHAGWRGLTAGVLEATVAATAIPAADLVAWLGPSIGPAHFEVADDVRNEALRTAPQSHAGMRRATEEAFQRNAKGRWQCDLPALARQRLAALGIGQVDGGEWCTAADPVRFFSHRRDQLTGRMAALIWRP
ncbi:MAG: peptidoglycan editing factor PgeF [Gammaproteobacteria bacterium]|nr:peptidoglycan editing factor PgeF [Gammaproteobacteria bacterium]